MITEVDIKLEEGVELPKYATEGSAGFDLKVHSFKKTLGEINDEKKETEFELDRQNLLGSMFIYPLQRVLIGTGIYIKLARGKELQIRSKSGRALKKGLIVLNQPGTIDSDYIGEVMIIIQNQSSVTQIIKIGDEIAQGVITDHYQAKWNIKDELIKTERGTGGFGSTLNK